MNGGPTFAIRVLLAGGFLAGLLFSTLVVLRSEGLSRLDKTVALLGLAAAWIALVSAAWKWAFDRLRALLQHPRHAQRALLGIEFALYTMAAYFALPRDLRRLSIPAAISLATASVLIRPLWLRFLAAAASVGAVLLVSWLHMYEAKFGIPGADTYAAVFQTDPGEAWSYFWTLLAPRSLALAAVVGLVMLSFRPAGNRIAGPVAPLGLKRSLEVLGIACGVVLFTTVLGWGPLKERMKTYEKSFAHFREEVGIQKQLLAELGSGAVPEIDSKGLARSSFEGTVVFVMGESITRRHMSLYGYHRDTTPNLERRRGELVVHPDTISPHSHTAGAVQGIFTAASLEDNIAFRDAFRNNLLIELRRSGFKTWWLSNQQEFGVWDNPASLVGKQANVVKFLRTSSGKVLRGGFYDEMLLPHLDEALADGASRKFVVLHTMAGHVPYCRFIPEDRRNVLKVEDGLGRKYFGQAEDSSGRVNCYDNAIRYVDDFLEQVVRRLAKRAEPAVLSYLSDHGEDVNYGTSHNSATHMAYHVEVPHLWYFNFAAREALKAKFDNLSKNRAAPYKASGHFHTLLDLAGADPSRFEPARSLVSTKFFPQKRKTVPRDDLGLGSVAYDDVNAVDRKDYLEVTRLVMKDLEAHLGEKSVAKLWSHRTNSIGKLLEAKSLFAGVELDIVYEADKREFYVYHPPMQSHGLRLEEYLAAARDRKELQFWFDWKNPEPGNFEAAMARLEALDRRFALKRRVIVETATKATFAELKRLTAYGFRHAYYMPAADIAACSESPGVAGCEALAGAIAGTGRSIGATILSFDASGRRFVEHNRKVFAPFRKIVWLLDVSAADRGIAKRLPDLSGYEVALIAFPSGMSY